MADKFLLHENITGFFLFEILEEEILFDRSGTDTYEKIGNLNKIVKFRSKILFNEKNFLKIISQSSENALPVELVNFMRINNVKFLFCDPSLHINSLNLGIRVGESPLISRGIRMNEDKLIQMKCRKIKWIQHIAEQKVGSSCDFLVFFDEHRSTVEKYRRMQEKLKSVIACGKEDDNLTEEDKLQFDKYGELYSEYGKIIEKREGDLYRAVETIFPMTVKFTSPNILIDLLHVYRNDKIIVQLTQQKLSRFLSKYTQIGNYKLKNVKSEFFKRFASKMVILLRMDIFKQYDEAILNKYREEIDRLYGKYSICENKNMSSSKKIKAKLFK